MKNDYEREFGGDKIINSLYKFIKDKEKDKK